jgi:hypothetical protein
MRESQEPARFWRFFCENFQKKLTPLSERRNQIKFTHCFKGRGRWEGKSPSGILAILWISLFFFACALPFKDPISPEVEKSTQVFDASEKIIVRAITQVLKDRGFGQAKEEGVGEDQRRLETEYVPQGEWRTKVEATVKKINPKEREVTLSVITEQKDSKSSDWKPKKIMGKDQYEKLFNEIEMQIYREWGKGQ